MQSFVEEFGLGGFDHVDDPTGRVWRMFQISSQPAYVFINDSGVIERESGALEADALAERVQALLDS